MQRTGRRDESPSAIDNYHGATKHTPRTVAVARPPDLATRPLPFHDYGDAERLPLEISVAGPLLDAGAGIVRSQRGRDYGGGTIHWRAYSSAGGLFPIEAYVAAADSLYSFDALSHALVRIAEGNALRRVAEAAAVAAEVAAFIVLTGIPARTGWKYGERGYRHVWWDAGTMLANLLALAAADGLEPRLYTGFIDDRLNDILRVDGTSEVALAALAVGAASAAPPHAPESRQTGRPSIDRRRARFPLAEAAHAAGKLRDAEAVHAWRVDREGEEPRLEREALRSAVRRRSSVRAYAARPLPRTELAELLAWSEAPISADAPSVVRQVVTVAAVEGLDAGIYDAALHVQRALPEPELRGGVGFVAMEQEHPRDGAVNIFQLANLDTVPRLLGERGYRWAQLEAGIRAGRLQVGAFVRGWGAAASTFYDDDVSRFLGTEDAPMLMVAIGARA